jgi:hypothetical protein
MIDKITRRKEELNLVPTATKSYQRSSHDDAEHTKLYDHQSASVECEQTSTSSWT